MNHNERMLIKALRPFASIAAHMPQEAMKRNDAVPIDDEHPDVALRTSDFQLAYKTILLVDPAFKDQTPRKPDLIDRTFGHPRWGYMAYTLLGLTGGYISASAHEWVEVLRELLQGL